MDCRPGYIGADVVRLLCFLLLNIETGDIFTEGLLLIFSCVEFWEDDPTDTLSSLLSSPTENIKENGMNKYCNPE